MITVGQCHDIALTIRGLRKGIWVRPIIEKGKVTESILDGSGSTTASRQPLSQEAAQVVVGHDIAIGLSLTSLTVCAGPASSVS